MVSLTMANEISQNLPALQESRLVSTHYWWTSQLHHFLHCILTLLYKHMWLALTRYWWFCPNHTNLLRLDLHMSNIHFSFHVKMLLTYFQLVLFKYNQALSIIKMIISICIYIYIHSYLRYPDAKYILPYNSSTIEFLHNGMKWPALFVQLR